VLGSQLTHMHESIVFTGKTVGYFGWRVERRLHASPGRPDELRVSSTVLLFCFTESLLSIV
jgi:hypothetical protein